MSPENIAAELRSDLLAGRLAPGSDLPQTNLAERFSVSRIPIRDALRILAADGLVTVDPGRGARVVSLDRMEIDEIYDIRLLLETDCLERACDKMTPDDLDSIDRHRKRAALDVATPDWDDSDWAFHEALYRPANRPRQMALIRALRRTSRMLVSSYSALPTAHDQWVDHHDQIMAHLRDGDRKAAVATLAGHLEGARRHLIEAMAAKPELTS